MPAFQLTKTDTHSSARLGLLNTEHGTVQTPVFMPIGTAAAVKGTTPDQLRQTGASVVLANTYHLMLRPGAEIVEKLGGINKLMAWDGPILTDSGGYQVFSLEALTRIDDHGVEFASHIDGKRFYLTAEEAIKIQNQLGADIIMAFDQCTPYPCPKDQLQQALERTLRWAQLCKKAHKDRSQMLFGIVQGEIDLQMRSYCAEELVKMDFDGYAIGGLSVGEGHENMKKTVEHTAQVLPKDKPRYLMGVGTPADIIEAVKSGVDMFDCVLPTRNGRNACAFTENGPIRLRNNKFIEDTNPIEPGCDCYCCQTYSRASIRHFFNTKEMLGPIMLSLHNLAFYQRLMKNIRDKIDTGQFADWAEEKITQYKVFNSVPKPGKNG